MARLVILLFFVLPAAAAEPDALAISQQIQARHVPFGILVDPFYASATSDEITGYTRCGDAAIWTGHYLAAEAFRFAVTAAPAARDNAARAIDAIEGLVDVTGTGLLARCRIPRGSPFAAGIHSEERANGVFTNPVTGDTWIGNTSRDQYLGVVFGLGVAYEHIPGLRTRAAAVVTKVVGFLVDNNWNPPGGSTFALRADQVLGILQVARRLNPGRFGDVYAAQRAWLALSVGTPVAFDSLSTSSYFKFNLIYITFFHLIAWEDSSTRGVYERAYAIARDYTAGHQNAFFNLIDHALFGPDARRDAETVALLDLWLRRPRRDTYVDLSNRVRVCGSQACDPIPVDLRTPTDFLWQRNPFQLSGGGAGTIGNAGVDYILPYWMARYYGVIPSIGVAPAIAPDSLVSLYGVGLGESVSIGGRTAEASYLSPAQINLLVPAAVPFGRAAIVVNGAKRDAAIVDVVDVAPAVFTLNAAGLAAATAIDADHRPVPIFTCNPNCEAVPADTSRTVYLTLYATGLRRARDTSVTIGGVRAALLYAGAQSQFPGLDQINVEIPRNLRGRVTIEVTAGGRTANPVFIETVTQ
jgi:uncharacterized protein (TIGR03437 family)